MEIRQAALLRAHHPAVGSKCCRATSAPPVFKDETGLNAKRNGRRVRRGHESYNGRQRHRREGEVKSASENSSQKCTARFQAAKQSDRQSDSGHHNSHGTASRTRDIADLALNVVPMINGLGEGSGYIPAHQHQKQKLQGLPVHEVHILPVGQYQPMGPGSRVI